VIVGGIMSVYSSL